MDPNNKLLESNTIKHALRELAVIGLNDGDKMNQRMHDNLIELLGVFVEQGHSGFSASYLINTFEKLARFQPLAPLTGTDDEWNEVGDGMMQNNRCSEVFMENGAAFHSGCVVFREPNGCCFTGKHSSVPVTFPYSPKKFYADVPEDASDEVRKAAAEAALVNA